MLTISGPEISDLSPLGSLERVGSLNIVDTVALRNLAGLSRLRAVRQLAIHDNDLRDCCWENCGTP